jgi:rubrerythrin
MPFIEQIGLKGKIYVPEKIPGQCSKHPCRDCFSCQLCSDDRCNACLNKKIENKFNAKRRKSMKFESFEDVVKYAMEKEKEAAEFYEKAKDEETMSGMKQALEEFAIEEKKHYAMLEDIANNKEKIESYNLTPVTDLKISDYMTEIEYKPGMLYPDLLVVAMKREEQAFKFYSSLVEGVETEELQKVFKILANEEAKHKNFLETQYDNYLKSQGG